MARRLDEEQAAVNARVLDIALTLSGKLLPEVGRVLVLDVLHDGVPATPQSANYSLYWKFGASSIPSVIVHLVAVPRSIDNVQSEPHSVLLND